MYPPELPMLRYCPHQKRAPHKRGVQERASLDVCIPLQIHDCRPLQTLQSLPGAAGQPRLCKGQRLTRQRSLKDTRQHTAVALPAAC